MINCNTSHFLAGFTFLDPGRPVRMQAGRPRPLLSGFTVSAPTVHLGLGIFRFLSIHLIPSPLQLWTRPETLFKSLFNQGSFSLLTKTLNLKRSSSLTKTLKAAARASSLVATDKTPKPRYFTSRPADPLLGRPTQAPVRPFRSFLALVSQYS